LLRSGMFQIACAKIRNFLKNFKAYNKLPHSLQLHQFKSSLNFQFNSQWLKEEIELSFGIFDLLKNVQCPPDYEL
jgi:hypothetical protein